MKLNYQWATDDRIYSQGTNLSINGIQVGNCSWNGSMNRNETENYKETHRYIGRILLPAKLGSKYKPQYASTQEDCQKLVEGVIERWFQKVLEGGE